MILYALLEPVEPVHNVLLEHARGAGDVFGGMEGGAWRIGHSYVQFGWLQRINAFAFCFWEGGEGVSCQPAWVDDVTGGPAEQVYHRAHNRQSEWKIIKVISLEIPPVMVKRRMRCVYGFWMGSCGKLMRDRTEPRIGGVECECNANGLGERCYTHEMMMMPAEEKRREEERNNIAAALPVGGIGAMSYKSYTKHL